MQSLPRATVNPVPSPQWNRARDKGGFVKLVEVKRFCIARESQPSFAAAGLPSPWHKASTQQPGRRQTQPSAQCRDRRVFKRIDDLRQEAVRASLCSGDNPC